MTKKISNGESATPGSQEVRGKAIIKDWRLTFDPGDARNGSLYLCSKIGAEDALQNAIDQLRSAGLWSAETPKEVEADKKAAYSEQLVFIDAAGIALQGKTLLLARYDHPKFPSDEQRYQDWCQLLHAE